MTAKQHVLLAVLFGVVAASQAVVGYGFDHHGQTATAVSRLLSRPIALQAIPNAQPSQLGVCGPSIAPNRIASESFMGSPPL